MNAESEAERKAEVENLRVWVDKGIAPSGVGFLLSELDAAQAELAIARADAKVLQARAVDAEAHHHRELERLTADRDKARREADGRFELLEVMSDARDAAQVELAACSAQVMQLQSDLAEAYEELAELREALAED